MRSATGAPGGCRLQPARTAARLLSATPGQAVQQGPFEERCKFRLRLPMMTLRLLLCAVVTLATACGGGSGPPETRGPVITVFDFGFTPRMLTVRAGEEFTWLNEGKVSHAVVTQPPREGAMVLNLQVWPGGTATAALGTPGTYQYHCRIHPAMKGQIVVV